MGLVEKIKGCFSSRETGFSETAILDGLAKTAKLTSEILLIGLANLTGNAPQQPLPLHYATGEDLAQKAARLAALDLEAYVRRMAGSDLAWEKRLNRIDFRSDLESYRVNHWLDDAPFSSYKNVFEISHDDRASLYIGEKPEGGHAVFVYDQESGEDATLFVIAKGTPFASLGVSPNSRLNYFAVQDSTYKLIQVDKDKRQARVIFESDRLAIKLPPYTNDKEIPAWGTQDLYKSQNYWAIPAVNSLGEPEKVWLDIRTDEIWPGDTPDDRPFDVSDLTLFGGAGGANLPYQQEPLDAPNQAAIVNQTLRMRNRRYELMVELVNMGPSQLSYHIPNVEDVEELIDSIGKLVPITSFRIDGDGYVPPKVTSGNWREHIHEPIDRILVQTPELDRDLALFLRFYPGEVEFDLDPIVERMEAGFQDTNYNLIVDIRVPGATDALTYHEKLGNVAPENHVELDPTPQKAFEALTRIVTYDPKRFEEECRAIVGHPMLANHFTFEAKKVSEGQEDMIPGLNSQQLYQYTLTTNYGTELPQGFFAKRYSGYDPKLVELESELHNRLNTVLQAVDWTETGFSVAVPRALGATDDTIITEYFPGIHMTDIQGARDGDTISFGGTDYRVGKTESEMVEGNVIDREKVIEKAIAAMRIFAEEYDKKVSVSTPEQLAAVEAKDENYKRVTGEGLKRHGVNINDESFADFFGQAGDDRYCPDLKSSNMRFNPQNTEFGFYDLDRYGRDGMMYEFPAFVYGGDPLKRRPDKDAEAARINGLLITGFGFDAESPMAHIKGIERNLRASGRVALSNPEDSQKRYDAAVSALVIMEEKCGPGYEQIKVKIPAVRKILVCGS
ncbi:MAG: hypothetical protein ABH879_03055 [archaeon]